MTDQNDDIENSPQYDEELVDGGDGVNLSLNLDENEDESAMRAQAGLNSPKCDPNEYDQLQVDSDGNEDGNAETPNTQLRNQYGVNSPKSDKKIQFSVDDDVNGSGGSGGSGGGKGVESLVTQVPRNQSNGAGKGVESLVTQVPREDNTQGALMETTQSKGCCSWFSCLWSCCSQQPVSTNSPSAVGMNQIHSATEKPDDKLLQQNGHTNGTTTKTTARHSISESSTIYDGDLLPPLLPEHQGKKCLVLDLDETLVHSSFKPIPKPDFIIPVEIDRVVHHVYVLKRPYVDEFLERCAKVYEIVIFTASLAKYADPLLDKLDPKKTITHRLFRESCVIHGTAYVKDLRKLNRKLKDTLIVDNSPPSYLFQPQCAVPITSWFDDQSDTQLLDFLPVLETTIKDISDVRKVLDAHNKSFRWLCNQANKPLEMFD